jgi:hypothetical protein
MGDSITHALSHQVVMNGLLNEFASWKGLRVKVWKKGGSNLFPGGVEFHYYFDYMKEILEGRRNASTSTNIPYIFHMSWTENKDNKRLYYQQMGEWYVNEEPNSIDGKVCSGVNCCLPQPNITCHFRDKPSKIPCRDSPAIQQGGHSFW